MVSPGIAANGVLRPPQVRGANRSAVLVLLQQNDYLSRADVARQSGLSEGAVSRIVNSLMRDGLVREDGAENSTGGRPGRRLALNPRRVLFGAEIQNWETRCAVSTMQGRIVETRRFRTPATAEETVEQIAKEFLSFKKELGTDRLPGAGICARGIVNSETGVLVLGSRPEWRNVPIRKLLEKRIKEPVIVENNVRAAALAEYTYGTADVPSRRCFVFVKVDEGVGMGVLFDGKLYHGPHMAAGEIGQIVVQVPSGRAQHDRPGCLEALVANPAVCNRYSEVVSSKRQASATGDITARVRRIAENAVRREKDALTVIEEASHYLGIGISNIAWGLDADVVVVDGAITEAWSLVEPILRQQMPDYGALLGSRDFLIRRSALGGEAALVGAATLPLSISFSRHLPSAAPSQSLSSSGK
jgi:predicted NBD/HSP70 family sugar kinase/biotin operon repressor